MDFLLLNLSPGISIVPYPFSIKGFPNIKETYIDQNGGKLPKEGEIYKNPYLANTYRLIAENGRDAFYKGKIAKTIDLFFKEQGGFLSKKTWLITSLSG